MLFLGALNEFEEKIDNCVTSDMVKMKNENMRIRFYTFFIILFCIGASLAVYISGSVVCSIDLMHVKGKIHFQYDLP
jgi:hypothetical protein